jgi:hypothetical protein
MEYKNKKGEKMTLLDNPWREAENEGKKIAEINIQYYIANIIDAINAMDRDLRVVLREIVRRIDDL